MVRDAGCLPPTLRIGIVGAGRTKNGLGPFLASAFEAAGCRVTAIAGRDLPGAERAAAELGARLGHAVVAHPTAHLLAQRVDALVVASPPAAHLDGLLAAHAAGIPCLCEKPLVPVAGTADGLALAAAFRARGILLAENCQWPFVLPAVHELHPGLSGVRVATVAMGLSPSSPGRAMIENSLSHVLSFVQALVEVDPAPGAAHVRQSDPGPAATRNLLTFELATATGPVAVELHLAQCRDQPRPAWLAVNGHRIDRRIGAGYAQSFIAAGKPEKAISVTDPLHQLVYRFAALLETHDREHTVALAESIAVRLRCQQSILTALGPAA